MMVKRIHTKNNLLLTCIVIALLIVATITSILWLKTEPASHLSAGKAYEIALKAARSSCQSEAKNNVSLDCTHISLNTIDYLPDKSYSATDPPGTWDFWFNAGVIPNLWDYTVSLDLDGQIVLEKSKILH